MLGQRLHRRARCRLRGPQLEALSVTPLEIVLLTAAAFCAGLVDAIAGGGGLITLPSLLAVGLPPHVALGTNKGGSVFGSGAALLRFARAGLVDARRAKVGFPVGLLGSFVGAAAVMVMAPQALRPVVLFLLVGAVLVVTFRPPRVVEAAHPAPAHPAELSRTALIAFVLGAYDGFFGPGMGTFLILAFVTLLGDSLRRGSANAKVVNFATNVAAVLLFATRGLILWKVSLPMAAGQFAGGFLGAHLTVKGGDRLVRRAVLLVVIALVSKLAYDWAENRQSASPSASSSQPRTSSEVGSRSRSRT